MYQKKKIKIYLGDVMFKYEKDLLTFVEVERKDPKCAKFMQKQLSSINMGLKSAIQFMSQGYKSEDEELKSLLLKLSAEELSNYELIIKVVNLLSGEKECSKNFSGTVFPDAGVVLTGDICTDLLSDIALMEQSKAIYCELYKQIDDIKVKEVLSFIIKREESFSQELREEFNKIQRRKVREEYKTNKEARICFSTIKPKLKENAYEEFKNTPPTFRF